MDNSSIKLMYCGLATLFNSTCDEKVQEACSSPGPMFDLTVGQAADIVWINSLDSNSPPPTPSSRDCMNNPNPRCALMGKLYKNQTFIDPTNHINTSIPLPITPKNWPITTHVHGA